MAAGDPGEERRQVGAAGEAVARRYLAARGYVVIGQNLRLGRRSEIDLLVRDGQTVVFVEVKARSSDRFGRPEVAVTARKVRAVERAMAAYLQTHPETPAVRFDVVAVRWGRSGVPPEVRHFRAVGEGGSLAFP